LSQQSPKEEGELGFAEEEEMGGDRRKGRRAKGNQELGTHNRVPEE
jgi:hypothetical protein